MFEKEAEEWVNKEYDNSYYPDCNYSAKRDAEQAYIAGAEFGYDKANEELEEKIKVKKLEMLELKSQIKKMKCGVIFLVKDRMNDDIDQNIIERLAEKWGIKEND